MKWLGVILAMESKSERSKAAQFLKSLVEIEQEIVAQSKERECLENELSVAKEQLRVLDQWIDLLFKTSKTGENFLLDQDMARDGLTIQERLQMFEIEKEAFYEKRQNVESKLELTQIKIENLEQQFDLLTLHEKNLYNRLVKPKRF